MKNLITVLAIVLAMGFSPGASSAGVKTIKPAQLQPVFSSIPYKQTSSYVSGYDTTATFHAEVRLPVGRTLKRIVYYHQGTPTAYTSLFLYRTSVGEPDELMGYTFESDQSGAIVPVEITALSNPKIKSGYTYWVQVVSSNQFSTVRGIKFFY